MSREIFQKLRSLLMEKLETSEEMTDREIQDEIDHLILNRMRDSCMSLNEKVQLRQELFHSVRKLDVLQELIEDESVTEDHGKRAGFYLCRAEWETGEVEQEFYFKGEAGRCDPADRRTVQQGDQ